MPVTYSPVARYLHWAIAGLIVLQFVLAQWAEALEDTNASLQQLAVTANHKSVGMTILMLAVVRLGWRLLNPPPELPASMPRWQVASAKAAHWAFYALLLALPLSGWLMSSASAYSVSWFNLFVFPDLVIADEAAEELFETVHETLAKFLFVLGIVHIVAALAHHFRDRDDVLTRMVSPASVSLGILLLAAGVWQLGFGTVPSAPASPAPAEAPAAIPSAGSDTPTLPHDTLSQSTLPQWQIDYDASRIEFSGEQAGAPFSGTFASWQADIEFDPEHLELSRAGVAIELVSVDTRDAERDETLGQPEWFAGKVAHFHASEFKATGPGEYHATNATLAFGAEAHPIDFRFNLQRRDGRDVLQGKARLDRLALGIGTGDWTDTTWVGQFVDVDVVVTAFR